MTNSKEMQKIMKLLESETTVGERYNAEVKRLMPNQPDLLVDPTINDAGEIDEIVYRRGEYLGGMATVILELIKQN